MPVYEYVVYHTTCTKVAIEAPSEEEARKAAHNVHPDLPKEKTTMPHGADLLEHDVLYTELIEVEREA